MFNLADSSIVTGGVLLVLLALTGRELDGTRVARPARGEGRGPEGARQSHEAVPAGPPQAPTRRPRTRRRRARRSGPTVGDTRQLPVPDGLDGMRVDAGLSRLLGLSRTAVATLAEEGRVAVDGRAAGKSDRLVAGSWLEVDLPEPERPTTIAAPPEVVAGLTILLRGRRHRRGRQAGRRRRAPQPRLDRPDGARRARRARRPRVHLGRGRAAGHRAPARRRHDRGHGRREVRARLQRAEAGVQGAHRREALPRRRAGAPGPVARHRRRPDRPRTRSTTTSGPSSPAAGRASPTTTRSRRSGRRRCSTSGWRPGAPTRSGCTWRRCATRASATSPTAPTRCWRSGCGWSGSGCTPASWASTHPADGRWVTFTSPYPADLARALDLLQE